MSSHSTDGHVAAISLHLRLPGSADHGPRLEAMRGQLVAGECNAAGRHLKDLQLSLLLPGIKLSTSPDDFAPIKAMRLARFDGKTWVGFGEVIGK